MPEGFASRDGPCEAGFDDRGEAFGADLAGAEDARGGREAVAPPDDRLGALRGATRGSERGADAADPERGCAREPDDEGAFIRGTRSGAVYPPPERDGEASAREGAVRGAVRGAAP